MVCNVESFKDKHTSLDNFSEGAEVITEVQTCGWVAAITMKLPSLTGPGALMIIMGPGTGKTEVANTCHSKNAGGNVVEVGPLPTEVPSIEAFVHSLDAENLDLHANAKNVAQRVYNNSFLL